jgi:uncharacterized protein YggE
MRLPRPQEVDKAIEAAQDVLRAKTRFSLQNAEVLFTMRACAPLEGQAWRAALGDARRRAERLARLTGAKVGPVIAVSESGGPSLASFGSSGQGCHALRSLPSSLYEPALNDGTPDAVKVRVSLQVTFALAK